MSQIKLINHPDYIVLLASQTCRVLSSAVLNGGMSQTRSLLNLRVDKHQPPPWPEPADTLQTMAMELGLAMPVTGMMTAASMKSLSYRREGDDTLWVECWVTCGLSNLLRCGDPTMLSPEEKPRAGTINIFLFVSQPLSPQAMTEALILLTESKVTAIRDAGLISPLSGLPASGTGTDSHAVFCPDTDSESLQYSGKHTLAGELIGRAVTAACADSISLCQQAAASGDS